VQTRGSRNLSHPFTDFGTAIVDGTWFFHQSSAAESGLTFQEVPFLKSALMRSAGTMTLIVLVGCGTYEPLPSVK
jgi:hypothetical protein